MFDDVHRSDKLANDLCPWVSLHLDKKCRFLSFLKNSEIEQIRNSQQDRSIDPPLASVLQIVSAYFLIIRMPIKPNPE
jgi:hypothetical protein